MREDQYGFDDLGEGVRDVRGLSKRADAACGEAYAVLDLCIGRGRAREDETRAME